MTKKYEFEEGMAEISGFGGSCEKNCRRMVKAGLEFIDKNDLNPRWKSYKSIAGLVEPKNKDAEKVDEVIIEACEDSPSGGMHHAVVYHLVWIGQNSWEDYVKRMKEE